MKETAIEKRTAAPLKERAQYGLAFGVIALMLYVAGFPLFLLFFVGVLTFFIWKVFTSERRSETRRIFEFYLSANEILRDDDRRWFGFEIQDAITRGETIVTSMSVVPPLVHFALGALYRKLGDNSSAAKHLTPVVENSDELKIIFPTDELRDYVRVLRKIERAPAEAPLTSAAIRSLERARRRCANDLLDACRAEMSDAAAQLETTENPVEIRPKHESVIDISSYRDDEDQVDERDEARTSTVNFVEAKTDDNALMRDTHSSHKHRKTISEVLHDIYDKNIG